MILCIHVATLAKLTPFYLYFKYISMLTVLAKILLVSLLLAFSVTN